MRLTPEQEVQIIDAYQAWDGTETIDQFAQSQGISKQALYGLLRRRGVPTKTKAAYLQSTDDHDGNVGIADWLVDKVATQALKTILEENRRVHFLEMRIEQLETKMREEGLDPDLD